MDGGRLRARDKIRGLLDQGRDLLARGQAGDAVLAFERAAHREPSSIDAREGLSAARAAVSEADRHAAARLAEAEELLSEGRTDEARLLASTLFDGPRAGEARDFLDRVEPGHAEFAEAEEPPSPPVEPGHRTAAGIPARTVFAAACLALFAVIGTTLSARWDGFIERLGRAPAPQRAMGPATVDAEAEDDVIGRARRLMASGRAGEALALLGSLPPEHPSYPLARQLRAQVAAAGRDPATGTPE